MGRGAGGALRTSERATRETVFARCLCLLRYFLQEAADATTHIEHTRELHKLQAHLLYYQQLLRDFRKSVEFVQNTPNPAMDEDPDRDDSMKLLKLESENLLSEIDRLEKQRLIQSDRLSNVMALVRLVIPSSHELS